MDLSRGKKVAGDNIMVLFIMFREIDDFSGNASKIAYRTFGRSCPPFLYFYYALFSLSFYAILLASPMKAI